MACPVHFALHLVEIEKLHLGFAAYFVRCRLRYDTSPCFYTRKRCFHIQPFLNRILVAEDAPRCLGAELVPKQPAINDVGRHVLLLDLQNQSA